MVAKILLRSVEMIERLICMVLGGISITLIDIEDCNTGSVVYKQPSPGITYAFCSSMTLYNDTCT
jgi:hypothetical protein